MKKLLTAFLPLLIMFLGCTKEHIVEADTTYDTQWTPQFSIIGNNYHSLAFLLNAPPRKTLFRNIVDYKLEYRVAGGSSYSVLGSFPLDERTQPQRNLFFTTEHSLQENSDYAFRVAVTYIDSTRRVSADSLIKIPIVRGRIIKRIQPFSPLPSMYGFGLSSGFLFALVEHCLVKLDTLTGSYISLADSLYPEDAWFVYSIIAVDGQTMCIVEPSREHGALVRIKRFSLAPFRMIGSFSIGAPSGGTIVDISYHRNELYGLWRFGSTYDQQVSRHDPITGAALEAYPRTHLNAGQYQSLYSDGSNVWAMFSAYYDNRFIKLNLTTMNVMEEHRNPIFWPSKNCAWDGPNLWVFDGQDLTFVKIHPEGL